MLATLLGTVTLLRLLQLEKADTSMEVTLYQTPSLSNTAGITRFSPSSPVYPTRLRFVDVTVNSVGMIVSV